MNLVPEVSNLQNLTDNCKVEASGQQHKKLESYDPPREPEPLAKHSLPTCI